MFFLKHLLLCWESELIFCDFNITWLTHAIPDDWTPPPKKELNWVLIVLEHKSVMCENKSTVFDVLVDVSICLSGNKLSGCRDVETLILTDRHLTFTPSGPKKAATPAIVLKKRPKTEILFKTEGRRTHCGVHSSPSLCFSHSYLIQSSAAPATASSPKKEKGHLHSQSSFITKTGLITPLLHHSTFLSFSIFYYQLSPLKLKNLGL